MISLEEVSARLLEIPKIPSLHTIQFVGLEDPQKRELKWVTRSVDIDSYDLAMEAFTKPDPATSQLTRSLVFREYEQDAFWYVNLGSSFIQSNTLGQVIEKPYLNSLFSNSSYYSMQNEPLEKLLEAWVDCLRHRFGGGGSTMWISQRHLAPNGDEMTSSIFLLFCQEVSDRVTRYQISRVARDYIVNNLVQLYENRFRRSLDQEKERFSQFLSESEDRILLGNYEEETIRRLSPVILSGLPLLVTGETGTGKSVVTRKLHELSSTTPPRIHDRYGRLHCALSNASDLENELFVCGKNGNTPMIEELRGGTLVLEEIQHAPHGFQDVIRTRLLENTVRDTSAYLGYPRLIFTGSAMLIEEVMAGNLSEELFYQIRYFEIRLRPLRQRKEDLKKLCELILDRASKIFRVVRKQITDDAISFLGSYTFPGNIRELENMLIRAVATSDPAKPTLDANDIRI